MSTDQLDNELLLNDDLVLVLYLLVDFGTYLNARLVCKQWYSLSCHITVLRHHYETAHLGRAYGPATWHSCNTLFQLLLRNHHLDLNLGSEAPTIRSSQVIPTHFSCVENTYQISHGLLFAMRGSSVMCYNLNDPELQILWEYDLSTTLITGRTGYISLCETIDPANIGCSKVSLLVDESNQLIVFDLNIRRHGKTEVTLRKRSDYTWDVNTSEEDTYLSIQGDWILSMAGGAAGFLFHIPSSRQYVLQRDLEQQGYHRNATFAGQHFVASLVGSFLSNGSAIAVYEIPDSDANQDTRTLPVAPQTRIVWTYCVRVAENINQIQFIGASRTRQDAVAATHLHFALITYKYSIGFLNIVLSPEGNSHTVDLPPNPARFGSLQFSQHNLRVFEKPSHNPPKKYLSLYHISMATEEDGTCFLGKRSNLKMPKGLTIDDRTGIEFDELVGRIFIFKQDFERGDASIQVIRYI